MKHLLTHWKTSLAAIIVALLTFMLYLGKITVLEWAEGLGSIATIIGLLSKDWDKTKDDDSTPQT